MERSSPNSLLTPLALSTLAAVLVAVLWRLRLLASLQSVFLLSSGDGSQIVPLNAWLVVALIFIAALVAAAAIMVFGARRAALFVAGAVGLLGVLSFVLSRVASLDVAFAPIALAALLGALLSQLYRLWRLDETLSNYVAGVVKQVYSRPEFEAKGAGAASALKLLETVMPLNEAVVLRLREGGMLEPAARVQAQAAVPASEVSRNAAWREGVELCERAMRTGDFVVEGAAPAGENGTAAAEGVKVALPLRHEGQMMGALLVRRREELGAEDRALLSSVAAQIARDLHRERTQAHATRDKLSALFSARAAERRLSSLGAVGDLLRKDRLLAGVLEEMPDAHAVAYLDGTLIYANSNMLREAGLGDDETHGADLFSLLDRFRAGVFDEPSIAVRRVLQSGDPYEREIFFSERHQTLQLRIALIREQPAGGDGAAPPLCLLVSVSDVTRQKEFVSLKSDMVSLMSHELRTPITSINGFAELLVIDETLSEEQREFLMIIRSESQRLSRMIDTFLAVSKLEAGDRQSVTKVPLLVNDVVHEMIASFQPIAKKKRIRLVAQAMPSLPPVAADRGLITQVVSNLIDNAIKYSPERTTVTVSTALEADAIRIAVEDRGYGIPPESIDRVWEKFYRVARDGQQKDEESTGLGLAFVREVVEQHGGQVSLDSEIGRGSVFGFTLPRL